MKNPMTPAGIEPATFRFVAQHLNHCATAVPARYGLIPKMPFQSFKELRPNSVKWGYWIMRRGVLENLRSPNFRHYLEQVNSIMMNISEYLFFFVRARSQCHGCTAALRLIVLYYPISPSFRRSHLRRQVPPCPQRLERSQQRKVELCGRECSGNFAEMMTSTPFRDLLNAANLRHGTDGFTTPLKEDVLRILSP